MGDEFFDRTEFIQYFKDESDELLQSIDADLLRLESFLGFERPDPEIVNSLFRALHTIKGSAGMLDFGSVQQLAHRLENVGDLLRKDRMPLSESLVELLFEGRDFLTAVTRAAVDGDAEPAGVAAYIARLDSYAAVYEETAAVIEGINAAASTAAELGASAGPADVDAFEAEVERLLAIQSAAAATSEPASLPEAVAETRRPGHSPAAPKRGAVHQTIRVDIERLDLLLNLVGELVINRTRISDIAATLARTVAQGRGNALVPTETIGPLAKDLAESAALLARTTNEIQESIMKVRMVPISQVFDRFPRMVRDLSRARGKETELIVEGAATDLDKTIVDEVGEPLMHLVRNCIDHGIEATDVRIAAGKPPRGTIVLNAYHEGNQVIIEVRDDGGGIDLVKVRERGIKLGLISEADRPSDREIIELIFTPGFSTAAVVSDVSGRGVGMDVVKKNIMRLKGVFDVDTARGEGTKFTIKLPLTLAIIQALLVRVARELYAIPLDAVIESQRIEFADIRTVHGGEVITLRDHVVPLIRVSEFFELDGERDPVKAMVVIVGLGERQAGLVVDSFQGEQEIVIKPLSDVVGRIQGISGATILGNGSISLIIDVHSLVVAAFANERSTRAEFSGV